MAAKRTHASYGMSKIDAVFEGVANSTIVHKNAGQRRQMSAKAQPRSCRPKMSGDHAASGCADG